MDILMLLLKCWLILNVILVLTAMIGCKTSPYISCIDKDGFVITHAVPVEGTFKRSSDGGCKFVSSYNGNSYVCAACIDEPALGNKN